MSHSLSTLSVIVARIERVTPLVKRFTLTATDGQPLPRFSGGSHVIVQMRDNARSYANAYSLMSAPDDTRHYQIGVRREESSKGGSVFMHDALREGDTLTITHPQNLFALSETASHHVLIAGGIGITPFMSQLHDLRQRRASYELHYAHRSPEHGAFRDDIAAALGEHAHFYADSLGQQLDLTALLGGMHAGAHAYVCGPQGMIDAVRRTADQLGIAAERIHSEQFCASAKPGASFKVVLARSGRSVHVAEDESILGAIERDGTVPVECLCREGVCGTCETKILEGQAEHRDQYLSEAEKQSQQSLMICVSRARSASLVLDL